MSARLPRAPQTFEQLVLAFLTDLEQEHGLARNTVDAYRSDLVQFGAFLAGRDPLAVEHAELAAFVDELANSRAGTTPLAAATLQRKIACLRSFYRHLHRGGMIKHNPASELSNPRLAKRRPQARIRRPRTPQTFEQLVLAFLTDLEQERGLVLTDTLDGDDGAIPDGDVGGERPNDQRGAGGVGNGLRCVDGHREWPPPASA